MTVAVKKSHEPTDFDYDPGYGPETLDDPQAMEQEPFEMSGVEMAPYMTDDELVEYMSYFNLINPDVPNPFALEMNRRATGDGLSNVLPFETGDTLDWAHELTRREQDMPMDQHSQWQRAFSEDQNPLLDMLSDPEMELRLRAQAGGWTPEEFQYEQSLQQMPDEELIQNLYQQMLLNDPANPVFTAGEPMEIAWQLLKARGFGTRDRPAVPSNTFFASTAGSDVGPDIPTEIETDPHAEERLADRERVESDEQAAEVSRLLQQAATDHGMFNPRVGRRRYGVLTHRFPPREHEGAHVNALLSHMEPHYSKKTGTPTPTHTTTYPIWAGDNLDHTLRNKDVTHFVDMTHPKPKMRAVRRHFRKAEGDYEHTLNNFSENTIPRASMPEPQKPLVGVKRSTPKPVQPDTVPEENVSYQHG